MDVFIYALELILDDPACAGHIDKRAEEILGRSAYEAKDEDVDWWRAKTDAIDELIVKMRNLNKAQ